MVYNYCPLRFALTYGDPGGDGVDVRFRAGRELHKAIECYLQNGELNEQYKDIIISNKPYLDTLRGCQSEVKLAVDENYKPCDFESDTAFIRGVVDAVQGNRVIEFKFGKSTPLDYSIQMEIYAFLMFCHYDYQSVTVELRYMYPAETRQVRTYTDKNELACNILKQVIAMTEFKDAIVNTTFGPRCVDCDWCCKCPLTRRIIGESHNGNPIDEIDMLEAKVSVLKNKLKKMLENNVGEVYNSSNTKRAVLKRTEPTMGINDKSAFEHRCAELGVDPFLYAEVDTSKLDERFSDLLTAKSKPRTYLKIERI